MPDRSRRRSDFVVQQRCFDFIPFDGAGFDSTFCSASDFWTYASEIRDIRGTRQTIKPVGHFKYYWRPNDVPTIVSIGANSWYKERRSSFLEYAAPYGWTNPTTGMYGPQYPASGLRGEMADKAFDAFFTQVPQEVDVANFLIDFKEIGSLIPSIQENIARTIGGGFLTYSFGWKPLIGDVEKLASILKTTRARIQWLKSTFGKRTPLGYTQSFTPIVNAPSTVGTIFDLVQTEATGTFTSGGYLTHRLQRLDGLEGEIRGLIAALGLNSPGKIVWERIPFSFIVDWVSRVGRLADKGTIQPFTGAWDVYDVSHSYKMRVAYKVTVSNSLDYNELKGKEAGELVYEFYYRDRGLPLSSALFYGRELTPQQLALSAALIGAASK